MLERSLTVASAGTGAPAEFSGKWINELGSTMTIEQAGDTLSGVYESKVSSSGTTTAGDLLGYVDGNLISFVVHWRDFQAITAWVGQLVVPDFESPTIDTLWQMTTQGPEWSSINAGADRFTPQH
jgi:hypothetical protein